MSTHPTTEAEFDAWLDGIPALEEDHIFLPPRPSKRITDLMRERDIAAAAVHRDDDDEPGEERSLAEALPDAVADLDQQIADAIAEDHPNVRRIRLRALSDTDHEKIDREIRAIEQVDGDDEGLHTTRLIVQTNLRLVTHSIVADPKWTPEMAQKLRARLGQGEWIRLLTHIGELTDAHAEQVTDLPNS